MSSFCNILAAIASKNVFFFFQNARFGERARGREKSREQAEECFETTGAAVVDHFLLNFLCIVYIYMCIVYTGAVVVDHFLLNVLCRSGAMYCAVSVDHFLLNVQQ